MKRFQRIFSLTLILVLIITSNVFAVSQLGDGLNQGLLNSVTTEDNTISSKFENPLNMIFGTLFLILKVVGVFGIALQGVRYITAGAQAKAQIKQSLVWLIVGTVCIFGADLVVNLISQGWSLGNH